MGCPKCWGGPQRHTASQTMLLGGYCTRARPQDCCLCGVCQVTSAAGIQAVFGCPLRGLTSGASRAKAGELGAAPEATGGAKEARKKEKEREKLKRKRGERAAEEDKRRRSNTLLEVGLAPSMQRLVFDPLPAGNVGAVQALLACALCQCFRCSGRLPGQVKKCAVQQLAIPGILTGRQHFACGAVWF